MTEPTGLTAEPTLEPADDPTAGVGSAATGVRLRWDELPVHVREGVEKIIGGTVTEALSQAGGFSPGLASRVRTSNGLRAFVKAVSADQNADSPRMYRDEARISAALPESVPAPRVLGTFDDGHWIAIVFNEIDGWQPATPWGDDELGHVLTALRDLARTATPCPVDGLPTLRDALAEDLRAWDRITEDAEGLDPWVAAHLPGLRALGTRALSVLGGDTLVQWDMRADNLLIDGAGTVTIVDWPWAATGPAWADTVGLLVNVALFGGQNPHRLLESAAGTFGADLMDLVAVLAGLAGYFTEASRRPAPRNLPTIRAFQRAQGEAVLAWLRAENLVPAG